MADFPEALDAALRAYYSVTGEYRSGVDTKRGFQARTGALERAYGSQKAAAQAAGVSPDTWSKWKRGKSSPTPASQRKIARAHTSLLRAAKVKAKGYPREFGIRAVVAAHPKSSLGRTPKAATYYNGGSATATAAHRWFNTLKLKSHQYANVVNAWAAGQSPGDVAGVLSREIEHEYPGNFQFEGNDVTVEVRG